MIYRLIASAFGLGFFPVAPGTVGAIGGCLVWVVLQLYSGHPQAALLILLAIGMIAGIYSSTQAEKQWGKDNKRIVIDEVVGMWVSLIFVPFNVWYLITAFILFRVFDIWKPLFIRRAEKLKGGWGIMMDDVAAGIYSCIIMLAVVKITQEFIN